MPDTTVPTPQAYTVDEAADVLRISRGMVYKLIAAGKLDKVKLGARTVIRADDLERLLSARAR